MIGDVVALPDDLNMTDTQLVALCRKQDAQIDRMQDALHKIESWSTAYPLKVFPEPDWKRVRELLAAGGITLDAVSASNMRHVVKGVGEIARTALDAGPA